MYCDVRVHEPPELVHVVVALVAGDNEAAGGGDAGEAAECAEGADGEEDRGAGVGGVGLGFLIPRTEVQGGETDGPFGKAKGEGERSVKVDR